MQIGIIGSFPPSTSGIAEFTDDFVSALTQIDTNIHIQNIPVVDPSIDSKVDQEVLCTIQKDHIQDYIEAAKIINTSSIDALVIQHEFATYGGVHGANIIKLIQRVTKPMVLIAHTVPVANDAHHVNERKQFFQAISDSLKHVIVFLPEAKQTLISYGYPSNNITIIPHGVNFITNNTAISHLREQYTIPTQAFIVLSFGFFHQNKGTAYTIDAMKKLVDKGKNVYFIYTGTTLPIAESQEYFKKIRQTIQEHHLHDHIRLEMNFVTKKQLTDYLTLCDVGIVPYIYKSYTASGPLSFFIGAGKPIITTPFAYATSILSPDDACFVPFKNSNAIAENIIRLQQDQQLYSTLTQRTNSIRSTLLWNVIAKRYLEVIASLITNTPS